LETASTSVARLHAEIPTLAVLLLRTQHVTNKLVNGLFLEILISDLLTFSVR